MGRGGLVKIQKFMDVVRPRVPLPRVVTVAPMIFMHTPRLKDPVPQPPYGINNYHLFFRCVIGLVFFVFGLQTPFITDGFAVPIAKHTLFGAPGKDDRE